MARNPLVGSIRPSRPTLAFIDDGGLPLPIPPIPIAPPVLPTPGQVLKPIRDLARELGKRQGEQEYREAQEWGRKNQRRNPRRPVGNVIEDHTGFKPRNDDQQTDFWQSVGGEGFFYNTSTRTCFTIDTGRPPYSLTNSYRFMINGRWSTQGFSRGGGPCGLIEKGTNITHRGGTQLLTSIGSSPNGLKAGYASYQASVRSGPMDPLDDFGPDPAVLPPVDRRSKPMLAPLIKPIKQPKPKRADPLPKEEPDPQTEPNRRTLPLGEPRIAPKYAPPFYQPQRLPGVAPLIRPRPNPLPQEPIPDLEPLGEPLTPEGRPAPRLAPPVVRTPQRQIIVAGVAIQPQPPNLDPVAIATELGALEAKLELSLNLGGGGSGGEVDLGPVLNELQQLRGLLERDVAGAIWTAEHGCEAGGSTAEPILIPVPAATDPFSAIMARFDSIADLLQAFKDLPGPVCRPPRVSGRAVTVSFKSEGASPMSGARLRKRLRYRCQSGGTLESSTSHWRGFEWNAGSVVVNHVGAPWGKVTAFASTEAEGKRLIQHAGVDAGIDPDAVGEWVVRDLPSGRLGQSGRMSVKRLDDGAVVVTSRQGSDSFPYVVAGDGT